MTGEMRNPGKILDGDSYCRGCGGTEYIHDYKTMRKECAFCGTSWRDRDAPNIASFIVRPEPAIIPGIICSCIALALFLVPPYYLYKTWTTYPSQQPKPVTSTSWQQTHDIAMKSYHENLYQRAQSFCLKKDGKFVPSDSADLRSHKAGSLAIISSATTVDSFVFCPED